MIRINEVEISRDEIAREMQYHPASSAEEAFEAAARALLVREALRHTCVAEGLVDVCPDDAEAEAALFERLLDKHVQVPDVDEATCRRVFENQPERFSASPLVEARHVLFAAPEDDAAARTEATQQAEACLRALRAGESRFEEAAERWSACPSKSQGGHLGQLSRGSTVPEFEQALMAAEEGLLPAPVSSRYGLHVVEVLHKVPGQALPFELARDKIATWLQMNARQQATLHYLHRVLAAQTIEGFDWQTDAA